MRHLQFRSLDDLGTISELIHDQPLRWSLIRALSDAKLVSIPYLATVHEESERSRWYIVRRGIVSCVEASLIVLNAISFAVESAIDLDDEGLTGGLLLDELTWDATGSRVKIIAFPKVSMSVQVTGFAVDIKITDDVVATQRRVGVFGGLLDVTSSPIPLITRR